MEKTMQNMTDVLQEIILQKGRKAISSRVVTVGMFSDLAPKMKTERRHLDLMYQVGVIQIIDNAAHTSSKTQRQRFGKAVSLLTGEIGLREDLANELVSAVCAALWDDFDPKAFAPTVKHPTASPAPTVHQPAVPPKNTVPEKPVRKRSPKKKKTTDLFDQCKHDAEDGDINAQLRLATYYAEGKECPASLRNAAVWTKKAAECGNIGAMLAMARIYEKGEGLAKSDKRAFHWYKKAAEAGNIPSQEYVAQAYVSGIPGVVKANRREATRWFAIAAEQGSVIARSRLRDFYIKDMFVNALPKALHFLFK